MQWNDGTKEILRKDRIFLRILYLARIFIVWKEWVAGSRNKHNERFLFIFLPPSTNIIEQMIKKKKHTAFCWNPLFSESWILSTQPLVLGWQTKIDWTFFLCCCECHCTGSSRVGWITRAVLCTAGYLVEFPYHLLNWATLEPADCTLRGGYCTDACPEHGLKTCQKSSSAYYWMCLWKILLRKCWRCFRNFATIGQ